MIISVHTTDTVKALSKNEMGWEDNPSPLATVKLGVNDEFDVLEFYASFDNIDGLHREFQVITDFLADLRRRKAAHVLDEKAEERGVRHISVPDPK